MIGAKTALGRQILNLEAGKSLLMRKNKPSNNHQRNNPCQRARIGTMDQAKLFTPSTTHLLPKLLGGAPNTSFPKFRSSKNPNP